LIKETERRRKIQDAYNKEHGIIPKTIIKEIREVISNTVEDKEKPKMSKQEKKEIMIKIENEMKKAVDCGYWNMFRFNPALKEEGKNPFTLDSKAPTTSYKDFILNEARYSSLTRSFPERAEELFDKAEKTALDRYAYLQKLSKLYEVE